MCLKLCRLDVRSNNRLIGLCSIASHCHYLQGLNLMGIPVTEVENHLQLWEILSDMKLTHLTIDLWFLPSVDMLMVKEKLIWLSSTAMPFIVCTKCS